MMNMHASDCDGVVLLVCL